MIGNKYYRVNYKGTLNRYEIIGFKNNVPVYDITLLISIKNDKYSFIQDTEQFATSNFSISIIKDNPNEWFSDLEEAKKVSNARFEEKINPNGDYKVARYFDDVFEIFVTDILSKKSASERATELNKTPRHYVSYSSVDVTNKNTSKNELKYNDLPTT